MSEEYPNIDAGNGDWIKDRARRYLRGHDMSLSNARSQASGWHFAKESLSSEEHRMLRVMEELLLELDILSRRGYAHVWLSEEKRETEDD